MIVGLDPGTERSALVVYDPHEHVVRHKAILPNGLMRNVVAEQPTTSRLYIEMIASYGMPVGSETFETVAWIGRFEEAWRSRRGEYPSRVFRKDIKIHLCGSTRAKDANVRQALLDLFPGTGGGSRPKIGTKRQPGPLYGMSKDMWAALAVAITAAANEGAI